MGLDTVPDFNSSSTPLVTNKITIKRYNDKNDGIFYRSYRCIILSLILL